MCQQWDPKRTEIPQTHEDENTTLYNLLDSVKLVLRGKFIAIQTFKKNKQTNKHLNKLTYQLKELAKEKNNTTWTEEWNEDQRENKRSKKACSILRVKTDKNFPPDPQKREKTPKKREMKGYITSTMKI